MNKILLSLWLIFFISACSKNESEIKNISEDDVCFYLANFYIINDSSQIELTSIEHRGDGYFVFKYKIKNTQDLWIKHYYDENNSFSHFIYRQSDKLTQITDSISTERIKKNEYPLSKRWELIARLPLDIKE